jgi:hypothetical protein
VTREQLEAAYPWSPIAQARARQQERLDGLENYLHVGGDRMSATVAARRLGVSRRTIVRWRGTLRAIGTTP